MFVFSIVFLKSVMDMWYSDDVYRLQRIALSLPAIVVVYQTMVLSSLIHTVPWPVRVALPQLVYGASTYVAVSLLIERRMSSSQTASMLCLLLASVLCLLLGPAAGYDVLLSVLLMPLCLRSMLDAFRELDILTLAIVVCFLAQLMFFATGHFYSFGSLQFSCAFVGFEDVNYK